MGRQLLRIKLDTSFFLYGISCHLKDYRFAWTINKLLCTNFKKNKPHVKNKTQEFSKYDHEIELDVVSFFANKSQDGFLIQKQQQIDYWLMFQATTDKKTREFFIETIRQNQHVLAIFEEKNIKTKEYFVF